MAGRFDLGAVLSGAQAAEAGQGQRLQHIDIDRIHADPGNFYAMTGIDELAANIATVGLLDPLWVRPDPDSEGDYVVVSGHRRRAALLELVQKDGREDLRRVPCIVGSAKEPEALQRLRLIFANSSTRQLSGAEISQQAEQVERLLYELKEHHGMEFSGRMRDHVAQAVQVSKSRLGRLKVIAGGLIPEYRTLWEAGKLDESPAYELARCQPATQSRLYEAFKGKLPAAAGIARLRNEMEEKGHAYRTSMTCPGTDKPCSHCDAALRHDAANPYRACHGEKCCMNCEIGGNRRLDSWAESCKNMCAKAEAKVARRREKEKTRQEEKERRELTKREAGIQRDAVRYAAAMREAGADRLQVGEYDTRATIDQVTAWAEGDFSDRGRLSQYEQSLVPRTVKALRDQIKALGCSADFLLGLSESLRPGPPMPEGWVPLAWIETDQTPTPPREGLYYAVFDIDGLPFTTTAEWVTSPDRWRLPGGMTIDGRCLRFFPLPGEAEP